MIELNPVKILRNPYAWAQTTIEWAKEQCRLRGINYCPHGYGECQDGCCYPGRCGRFQEPPCPKT